MAIFAEIRNDEVVNVLVAETLENAELYTQSTCIDITNQYVVIGDKWDGTNFTSPIIEEVTE